MIKGGLNARIKQMNIDIFIKQRKPDWEKLEALMKNFQKFGLEKVDQAEILELGDLYRRAVSDLSFAKSNYRDYHLLSYLNQLVANSYAKIYRDEPFSFSSITRYFSEDYPRLFRKYFRYILLAFLAFVLTGVAGFFLVTANHKIAVYEEQSIREAFNKMRKEEKWADIERQARPFAASAIMTNNIRVVFLSFAFGITAGAGTFFIMVTNGFHIGAYAGLAFMKGISDLLWSFVFSHGMIELTCIFIAGGAGFLIGDALLQPGLLTRKEALKNNSLEAVKLMAGTVPMLVLAGLIEGFISPSGINQLYKFGFGILTIILMALYFGFAGREKKPVRPKAVP